MNNDVRELKLQRFTTVNDRYSSYEIIDDDARALIGVEVTPQGLRAVFGENLRGRSVDLDQLLQLLQQMQKLLDQEVMESE